MLSDEKIDSTYRDVWTRVTHSQRLGVFARAIESAACEERDKRIAEFVSALDEEMVVSHIGVFNTTDDPRKAIKDLMLWGQGVGEYFAAENAKERIAGLEESLAAWKKNAELADTEKRRLERELEAVRKDAERYRWLRNTSNPDNPLHMIALHINDAQQDASLSGIDAAIDAAMKEQK